MRAWQIGLIFSLPAAVAAGSCALAGFERVDEPPGPETCAPASVPSPPSVTNAGGDIMFTVALKVLRLDTQADGAPLGLDLDRFCTCQFDDGPSCIAPMGQPDGGSCDGPDGRDNASPKLFSTLALAINKPNLSEFYSKFAENGVWGLLFRVSGYNGQDNDDQVRLDWYVSNGFGTVPLWDGSDAWQISSTSLQPGSMNLDETRYFDAEAYVTNGMLVAAVPEGQILLGGESTNIDLRLTTGSLVARIEQDVAGGVTTYRLMDGQLAARIAVKDIFLMVSNFRDDQGQAFCTDNLFYGTVKANVCSAPDIQIGSQQPNKPCDAVSFAAGFDAYPAQLGSILPAIPPSGGCNPDPVVGNDPINDSCNPPDAGVDAGP